MTTVDPPQQRPPPHQQQEDDEPMPEGEEPPPRGVKIMSAVRWTILIVAGLLALFMWIAYALDRWSSGSKSSSSASGTSSSTAAAKRYQCPMHPQIVSDEPGECPICHMDLVPIVTDPAAASSSSFSSSPSSPSIGNKPLMILDDSGPPAFYCPMHPEVQSAKEDGRRCPLCKMALEPIIADAGISAMSISSMSAPPPGTTPIQLSFDRIQAIGVRTTLVEERHDVSSTTADGGGGGLPALRVTAIVQPPEQGAAEVHVRTPGFIEAIHVDQTGKAVQAGQALLSIYSPEILQAQQELLTTRTWSSTSPDAGRGAGDPPTAIGVAARNKLELLGMPSSDIDRVLAKRSPMRAISVIAPRGGFITKKNVVLGSYVTPEMTLYEIQDLSRVYVVGDVFLRDIGAVAVGANAKFIPSRRPDDVRLGKIDLIYPLVTSDARTRRVRMEIANAQQQLAPGEYGRMEVSTGTPTTTTTTAKRRLAIPRDALVDTGSSTYVFVVLDSGRFVPTVVVVSPDGSDERTVLIESGGSGSGSLVEAGSRVVSGATFLIDSESRLRASLSMTSPMSNGGSSRVVPVGGDAGAAVQGGGGAGPHDRPHH